MWLKRWTAQGADSLAGVDQAAGRDGEEGQSRGVCRGNKVTIDVEDHVRVIRNVDAYSPIGTGW